MYVDCPTCGMGDLDLVDSTVCPKCDETLLDARSDRVLEIDAITAKIAKTREGRSWTD